MTSTSPFFSFSSLALSLSLPPPILSTNLTASCRPAAAASGDQVDEREHAEPGDQPVTAAVCADERAGVDLERADVKGRERGRILGRSYRRERRKRERL